MAFLQLYTCPAVGTSITLPDNNFRLGNFEGDLCTLTRVTDDTTIVPVARAYDGRDWEVSPGEFAGKLDIDCETNLVACRFFLPPLETGQRYQLTTYESHLDITSDADCPSLVARFLEQATYGPTPALIESWGCGEAIFDVEASFEDFIHNQINDGPVTSHREYFRERTNPRTEKPFAAGRPGPKPCEAQSRWRTFAFSVKDSRKTLTVRALNRDGKAPYVLMVDGYPRTVVDQITFVSTGNSRTPPLSLDKPYEFCYDDFFYREGLNVPYRLKIPGEAACFETLEGNPPIDLRNLDTLRTHIESGDTETTFHFLDLPSVGNGLTPIDEGIYESSYFRHSKDGDEFILDNNLNSAAACDDLPDPWGSQNMLPTSSFPVVPIYGRTQINGLSTYVLYDPRLILYDNTIKQPLPDGGGEVTINSHGAALCANAPRTFLNEDHCVLSTEPTACSAVTPPTFSVTLDDEFLKGLFDLTGRYVYAIDNLPKPTDETYETSYGGTKRYVEPPCTPAKSHWSRWMRLDDKSKCTNGERIIGPGTETIFSKLLRDGFEDPANPLPLLKDIKIDETLSCDESDVDKLNLGYVLSGDGVCWQHVHPEHLSVFDFSDWAFMHPGGSYGIQQYPRAAKMKYPTSHHQYGNERFYENIVFNQTYMGKDVNVKLGKFGDRIPFINLPDHLRTTEVEVEFGHISTNLASEGVVVCGSLGEVANKPSLGSGFDINVLEGIGRGVRKADDTTPNIYTEQHRNTLWSTVALSSEDQLRQRAAFALSQILVITPLRMEAKKNTETNLQYYDIFVRNAFGNYRDILKQVSFSPKMGEMLSYRRNRSYQSSVDFNLPRHPDENYAREIMQLFSIGLSELNMDGTPVLDELGEPIPTYDNTDIVSIARSWTGFDFQGLRGNHEAIDSRVDPMTIIGRWRDVFPKSDLFGGYIGDKYPLCVDLPSQHFLRRGATYRLLGSTANPELQFDFDSWENDPEVIRFELQTDSELYAKLCKKEGSQCTFPAKVVLDSNIQCTGLECKSDTMRTVRVQSEPFPVYYEYVRQPCVEQAFFEGGKRVMDFAYHSNVVRNNLCADPRRDIAAEGCCVPNSDSLQDNGYRFCHYQGERLTFSGAESRCEEYGMVQCNLRRIVISQAGTCAKDINQEYQKLPLYYHWTSSSCSVQVKVAKNGDIAIVHNPDPDYAGQKNVENKLANDNANYFKVTWNNGNFPKAASDCGSIHGSCVLHGENNDECLCDTIVTETPVFTMENPSRAQILSNIQIGAFHPDTFDFGTYTELSCGNGVTVFVKSGDCYNLDMDSIFLVEDDNGIQRYLKNMKSIVGIDDMYSFRNPVHFSSLVDPAVRDAYYETDAVIDHFFYHPTHPPFLAKGMIQKFGVSNPSPAYIQNVAEAYKNGSYIRAGGGSFGSGKYGDLGAMIAAILLDPEARSVSLDSDPAHGSLREPILKIMAIMRALVYKIDAPAVWPFLASLEDTIGQCAYEAPSVFNFFLPEYTRAGPIGSASLVSPESQVLTGAKITSLVDGIFALMKDGLTSCHGGFAWRKPAGNLCPSFDGEGDFSLSYGHLTHEPDISSLLSEGSFKDIVQELSLLLTASRLSEDSCDLIEAAMDSEYAAYSHDQEKGRGMAIRLAQQLMVTTPEFHSTNIVHRNGADREPDLPVDPGTLKPYKAVVYLMFSGGMDSFNLLVPKDCEGSPKDMYEEYLTVRGVKGLRKSKLLDIDASGSNQPCNTFGVNDAIPILKELYDDGEAMFLANTGVLQKPVDKTNWQETETLLFAHNKQRDETCRVDIENQARGTGVGGRIFDLLKKSGYQTSAVTFGVETPLLTGDLKNSNPITDLPNAPPRLFNARPSSTNMANTIRELNSETRLQSGVFGETWSSQLIEAIAQNKEQVTIFGSPAYEPSRGRFPTTRLGGNFASLSTWIKSHKKREVDREIFYIFHDGYDHHFDGDNASLQKKLREVNAAMKAFVQEMRDSGMWDKVTLMAGSEFGRTLTPNSGGGTDHSWAGNSFIIGGSVKGEQIKGTYPDNLTEDGDFIIGERGRLIPTLPLDAVWNGIAQYMGVSNSCDLDHVLPNRRNFQCGSTLFRDSDLFKDGTNSGCSLEGASVCADSI